MVHSRLREHGRCTHEELCHTKEMMKPCLIYRHVISTGGAAFEAYLARLEAQRHVAADLAAYYQSGGYAMFDRECAGHSL